MRRVVLTVSALTATGLLLSACGGSSSSTPATAPQKVADGQTVAQFWPLTGLKVVWFGEHADNPVIDPVAIDNMNALAESQLSVPAGVDVPLVVDFDDSYNINWLTSCGTMHDFDLARAHLHIAPDDPQSGTLAIVVRDSLGGVAWRIWPIAAR